MAWWIPLIAAGASLAGSMLSGAGKGSSSSQSRQLSPVGNVQASTAPAMGDFIAKMLAEASADKAPSDFQLRIGDQALPLNMAARRRSALSAPAAAIARALFGQGAFGDTTTTQQTDPMASAFPVISNLLNQGVGSFMAKLQANNNASSDLLSLNR